MLKEMNQDYKIMSLDLKRVGKCTMCPTTHTLFQCKPREVISHFNSFTTCCNSKISEGLWSLKNIFDSLNTSFQLLLLTANNIILIIILHFFSKASFGVFNIHWYKAIFKLRGFTLISLTVNYIFSQTQTNLLGWCPKV